MATSLTLLPPESELTEESWLRSDDPLFMISHLLYHSRHAVVTTPQGERATRQLVRREFVTDRKVRCFTDTGCAECQKVEGVDPRACFYAGASCRTQREKAAIIRDIFGNPFAKRRPLPYGRILNWNNGIVPKMALAIYDENLWDEMPILGDALEEAGCADLEILQHCRGKEMCWGCQGTGGFQANSTWVPCELCDVGDRDLRAWSPWLPLRGPVGKEPCPVCKRDEDLRPVCTACYGTGFKPEGSPHVRGCWVVDHILGYA
jgi:hypothetical protein